MMVSNGVFGAMEWKAAQRGTPLPSISDAALPDVLSLAAERRRA
ncbi:hypothetical protein [Dactylosporangium sp. NPDC051484]